MTRDIVTDSLEVRGGFYTFYNVHSVTRDIVKDSLEVREGFYTFYTVHSVTRDIVTDSLEVRGGGGFYIFCTLYTIRICIKYIRHCKRLL